MKAQLVVDSTRNNFRAIVERADSTRRFYPSSPNHKEPVEIRKANNEDLYSALFSIGVRLVAERYEENIDMIADKFYKELCTQTSLCYDEIDRKGFYITIEN